MDNWTMNRAKAVIESCETEDQLTAASNVLRNLEFRHGVSKSSRSLRGYIKLQLNNIHFTNQFNQKYSHLIVTKE